MLEQDNNYLENTSSVEDIPKHWFKGNPFSTHLINGLHLNHLVTLRYITRSLQPFADETRKMDPISKNLLISYLGSMADYVDSFEVYLDFLESKGYRYNIGFMLYTMVAHILMGVISFFGLERLLLTFCLVAETQVTILYAAFLSAQCRVSLDGVDMKIYGVLQKHGVAQLRRLEIINDLYVKEFHGGYITRTFLIVFAAPIYYICSLMNTLQFLLQDGFSIFKRLDKNIVQFLTDILVPLFRQYLLTFWCLFKWKIKPTDFFIKKDIPCMLSRIQENPSVEARDFSNRLYMYYNNLE